MYSFSRERSVTGRNFPFFFGTRNNQKFPDLVPFPLPVSGEDLQSLLVITGRKVDSDLSELMKEGELT